MTATLPSVGEPATAAPPRRAPWRGAVVTAIAVVVVWVVLLLPDDLSRLSPADVVRIPVEGLLIVGLLALLPGTPRRLTAVAVGVLLGVLTILKAVDTGFLVAFGRPSEPVSDWAYLHSGVDLLATSVGRGTATGLLVGGAAVVLAVLVVTPWALARVADVAARHRAPAFVVLATLGAAALAGALAGVRVADGPLASVGSASVLADHVDRAVRAAHDDQALAEAAAADPLRQVPTADLLSVLRGTDVLVVFVESYGQVALTDPTIAPGVRRLLADGTTALGAAGVHARSAWLTSPTFGGLSWLAHSTLQSGLWIDSQRRYDDLLTTDRATLTSTFARAGWRTVSDVPADEEDWAPAAGFYGYDAVYDARNVGYHGPRFGYATMPDQFVLEALWRNELGRPERSPVMAEVDLVSSHTPWTPLPRLVDWSTLGDGSVFDGMPDQDPSRDVLWRDSTQVRSAYGRSIEYTLQSLVEFVQRHDDRDLVLVVLGDHQPATIVSGRDAGHDVPVSIVTSDQAVLDRVAGWGWTTGLEPGATAPVERMDAFRDRFVETFSGRGG